MSARAPDAAARIATVRAVYDGFARRDRESVFALIDPEFELELPAIYPEGGEVFRGRAGLERWLVTIVEQWGEWRFEPERYADLETSVLVFLRLAVEGEASGVHLERQVAHLWSFEGPLLTRVKVYLERDDALAAVGLESAAFEAEAEPA